MIGENNIVAFHRYCIGLQIPTIYNVARRVAAKDYVPAFQKVVCLSVGQNQFFCRKINIAHVDNGIFAYYYAAGVYKVNIAAARQRAVNKRAIIANHKIKIVIAVKIYRFPRSHGKIKPFYYIVLYARYVHNVLSGFIKAYSLA